MLYIIYIIYVIYIISTYIFHYKIDIYVKKNANYILLYKYLHLTIDIKKYIILKKTLLFVFLFIL